MSEPRIYKRPYRQAERVTIIHPEEVAAVETYPSHNQPEITKMEVTIRGGHVITVLIDDSDTAAAEAAALMRTGEQVRPVRKRR